MKKINFTLLFSYTMLIAIIVMAGYSLHQAKHTPSPVPAPTPATLSRPDVDPLIKGLVPDAAQVQQLSQNQYVIKIIKADGSSVYGATGKGEGYQSEITMLVIMSPDHKIVTTAVLSQGDTPSKFKKLENKNFLSQFNGQNINTEFTTGQNIDTASGATYSCKGVTAAIANACQCLLSVQ
jgi:Na+-translocating ferredoxin:NAD+ oxidoreductase RnfG subunit